MKTKFYNKNLNGFSLMEVLIASSIFLVFISSVYTIMNTGTALFEKARTRAVDQMSLRKYLNNLEEDLGKSVNCFIQKNNSLLKYYVIPGNIRQMNKKSENIGIEVTHQKVDNYIKIDRTEFFFERFEKDKNVFWERRLKSVSHDQVYIPETKILKFFPDRHATEVVFLQEGTVIRPSRYITMKMEYLTQKKIIRNAEKNFILGRYK